uniref:HIPL1 protein-like n=1 Tax=Nicotiana tabacum TaxID=4097 RepID=A0A1S4DL44_TOBAC|nr:PREDICTED: HIPL1 protein-like [Nicotiana tabacum]
MGVTKCPQNSEKRSLGMIFQIVVSFVVEDGFPVPICDQYSAQLGSARRDLPALCNFTSIGKVHQPKDKRSSDFCSKLMHHWQSKDAFCETYSRSLNGLDVCFNRKTGSLGIAEAPQAPNGACLDKIGNWSYISMNVDLDESKPFLDITEQVHFDDQFRCTGIAFHPNFVNNGRFFVSYNCDKLQHSVCSGRCSCNSEVKCDQAKLPVESGTEPCQYHIVVAEFTANSTASTRSLSKFKMSNSQSAPLNVDAESGHHVENNNMVPDNEVPPVDPSGVPVADPIDANSHVAINANQHTDPENSVRGAQHAAIGPLQNQSRTPSRVEPESSRKITRRNEPITERPSAKSRVRQISCRSEKGLELGEPQKRTGEAHLRVRRREATTASV